MRVRIEFAWKGQPLSFFKKAIVLFILCVGFCEVVVEWKFYLILCLQLLDGTAIVLKFCFRGNELSNNCTFSFLFSLYPLPHTQISQEYFQGLESHMILTETLFRKMSSFALLKETRSHSELMTQASAVLKLAHKRGVELEYILEVRISVVFSVLPLWSITRIFCNVDFLCLDGIGRHLSLLSYAQGTNRLHVVFAIKLLCPSGDTSCVPLNLKELLSFSWQGEHDRFIHVF